MRRITLFFILVLIETALAQTPITLNNSNMPNSNDTLRYTNVALNSVGNYTQTGTNFSWDFSAVTSLTEDLRSFKSIVATPYALFFFSFNGFAEKTPDFNVGAFGFTDSYTFYRKQTNPVNAFVADGVGLTFSSVPLPSYYTDKDELYIFPMTYPQRDSSTFRFATPSTGLIPIRYIKTGYRITEVDGWGTVKTPYGTENCLRLVTTQYAQDSIKNSLVPFPFGFPNVQRSYQWLTLTSKIPYFEVTGALLGSNFTPTQVRYRGYKKPEVIDTVDTTSLIDINSISELSVYPNPTVDKIVLRGLRHTANLELTDLSGKILPVYYEVLQKGGDLKIDLSLLSKGNYILKVTDGGQSRHFKLVRE